VLGGCAGRLFDGSAPRRHQVNPGRPDRGPARGLWHAIVHDFPPHYAACDVALCVGLGLETSGWWATKDTSPVGGSSAFTELTLATRQAAGATKGLYELLSGCRRALFRGVSLVSNAALRLSERRSRRGMVGAAPMSEEVRDTSRQSRCRKFKGSLFKPHRIVMILIATGTGGSRDHHPALGLGCRTMKACSWLGVGRSLAMLFSSAIVGFILAVLLGMGMVCRSMVDKKLSAQGFCSIIRGHARCSCSYGLLYYGPRFGFSRSIRVTGSGCSGPYFA